MPYKTLLVQIDETKANSGRLQAAIGLARAHEAHLTGLYIIRESDVPGFVTAQLPRDAIEAQRASADEAAEAAVAAFLAKADREGINADARTARAQEHDMSALIARQARYADLVVAGQADPDEPVPGGRHLLEDLVLSAGRPVLAIPYIGASRPIGRTVTVAWDAGRESARAVADAMPFLEAAKEVHVVMVDPVSGTEAHGAEPGADIALSLARHGIKAEAHSIAAPDLEEGDAILSWLADSGSDLLVMGLYGHARFRELVLGGVSRRVLESMTVPVLMAR
jgi:nucleotide-binding universal stress UspA family protein